MVDSLLNFETVKLFACEADETERFVALSSRYSELQAAAPVETGARAPW